MMDGNKKTITLRIDENVHANFKSLCKARQESMSRSVERFMEHQLVAEYAVCNVAIVEAIEELPEGMLEGLMEEHSEALGRMK